ncbi:MAG TPA: LuxR C-terminal-related transcriptional regulator [Solirubrobacteraceae bacterium]|nr:LuxR C-terminal-related transcriptional regulator [Solirubrobacteraceae bacterium]
MLADREMNMTLTRVVMALVDASPGPVAPQTEHDGAIAHLRAALANAHDADKRYRATTLLAGLLGDMRRASEAADLIESQLPALDGRPDLQSALEVALARVTRLDPATRHRGTAVLDRLKHRVQDRGERDPHAMAIVAAELANAGESADAAAELAEYALAYGVSSYEAVNALIVADRYEPSLQALSGARDLDVLLLRAGLLMRMGEPAAAADDARAALDLAAGRPLAEERAAACLGEALVELGAYDEAERLLMDVRFTSPEVVLTRGRLRLAQGRIDEAIDDLYESGRRALALDISNPAVVPWRSLLAHALLQRGQVTEARCLAADELEYAHRFGAPRAIGIALRAVAAAAGGDQEIDFLREAVARLDGARLDWARAQTDLGIALRRMGRDVEARDPLRLAVDVAHRCGAMPLEERALAELRAAGARPRRRLVAGAGSLTPSERRIADLAAAGHLNREIADILVVTLATVEYHLRNAYRKLGIRSRRELATTL